MTAFDMTARPRGGAIEDIYPLTGLQQGMLFHSRLAPEKGMYWIQYGLLLDGRIDLGLLRQAWELVFARHEVLRTGVWDQAKVPVAVVSRSVPLPWQVIDLSGLDEGTRQRAVAEYEAADAARGADFAAPSLARVAVMRLGEDRYRVLWSYHHLLLDGWSAPVVVGDALHAYRELVAVRQPRLPSRRPFRDFVAWSSGQDQEAARRYWRERLAGLTAPTPLGVGNTTGETGQGTAWVRLPTDTSARVAEFARRHRLTVNTIVQGAWAVLTARYAGTDDVVFGVISSGRSGQLDGIEDMVGLLINTTPARIKVDPGQTVPQWLAGIQAEQARGRRFEHTALTDIQACSEIPAGQPLFETLFVFENYPTPTARDQYRSTGSDIRIQRILFEMQAHEPLAVIVNRDDELVVRLVYDRARFDDETAGRMARYLATVLEAIAADEGGPVADLPVLTQRERRRLIDEWNDTAVPTPPVDGAHDLIARAAPDTIALESGSVSLTYAALVERAARLAHRLREAGVTAETVVGLHLPPGPDAVIAILAVWLAGGAYLPLDPDQAADRTAFMLDDSGAAIVVGTSLPATLPTGLPTVVLDDPAVRAAIAASPPTPPSPVPGGPERLAYVIYTSGSTGTPKGVQVAHRGVVNLAIGLSAAVGAGPGTRVLQFAPLSFDGAVGELVMALPLGGASVVATPEQRAEPNLLAKLVRDRAVRVTPLPPSLLRVLEPGDLRGLGTLITVGERLDPDLAAAWQNHHRLLNGYGPTETTVAASIGAVGPSPGGGPPIGTPIANTRMYVLDARLDPVPVGVAGELFVGGGQLARGYGRRPALTAERFVADRFAGDGSRLYRTGDRVRWRADGQLEFLGRIDDQIKIRGFRIEPGEIETALNAHPAIRSSAVIAWGDGAGRRLAAYLVPADHAEGVPPVDVLRDHLRQSLPEFMIPALFTELADLPLTSSGKTDRTALPAPDQHRPDLDGRYTAPSSPTEELVAGIWTQVLGVDRVGAGDDFFQLGGHSLLAAQVMSRVRAVFGAEVPLAALFDHPTVRGLAEVIEGTARGLVVPPVTAVSRDRPLPLSFAQQRLWFLDRLEPGSAEYVVRMPIRWDAHVDAAVLGQALDAVVARHEVLRTRLVAGPDGVAHQVIDPPAPVPLPVADVSGVADPVAAARVLLAVDASTPFDLAAEPLVRACLIRLGETGHLLALTMHHVVFDEWSERILRRDLLASYEAFRAGEPDPLPPLAVQYADFAVWQRSWLTGEVLEQQLGYWRDRLAGAPVLELPTDRPRPPVWSTASGVVPFTVPADVVDGLRKVAQDGGATMFMVLLAGFSVLLGRYCGQDDIVVGTPVADRGRAETEDLIGFFLNTLVMRADLSGDPTFAEVLARVRETALGGYAHQDLPFEQLVDALVTDRDRSRTPLFRVFFSYVQGGEDAGRQEPDVLDDRDAGGPARTLTLADLDLTLGDSGEGGLAGAVQYSTALFDEATIQRLAAHLVTVLRACAVPGRRVAGLELLADAERGELRVWGTGAEPAVRGSVLELIAEQARLRPDAVAVVEGDRQLTYGELNARSNRLARHLRARGIGCEDVVGVCLQRGTGLMVALLGVLKAGAAYLPLDADHPGQRMQYMLQAAGATLVITQSEVADRLESTAVPQLLINGDQAATDTHPASDLPAQAGPGNLAYVIFTSGSTGRPNGVFIEHSAMSVRLVELGRQYGITPADSTLQFASITFDATVDQLFSVLMYGGRLVLRGAELWTPARVLREIRAQRVTMVEMTPAVWELAISDLSASDLSAGYGLGPDFRLLNLGGEAVPAGALADWFERTSVPVLNTYGPTEATITSMAWLMREPVSPVPIGLPVAGTTVYVLDTRLRPVPVGVAGELFIGGPGVARGYGGRPALTARRFVADPFAADGSRMYRTGDRVRWSAAGRMEFLGRADDQVKVRGVRIEPGEIEAALAAHPGVQVAVVTPFGESAQVRLVAYVVPADPSEGIPDSGDLRGHLRQSLPESMIPSVFVELAGLPLTSSNKIDRAALPVPDIGRTDQDGSYVAPSTPAEELLAGIWAELLGADHVGAEDNFFELGGHSLLATQVISRIRDAFGTEVPLAALFDQPTVRELAQVVEERILDEIERMSDDEVLQALGGYGQDARPGEDGIS
ncbi:non-ribosomal peptide synthetase [Streptomyces phyllanthi]|uniref:Amino acid adenylation domain-containing protein n=1 Tax=Streptomyces phyllanthi TaxID=1803180 RepID=A0A5N8WC00_9ACTN|nr:non-ribosomal peptide synthetase [Streptomyces phyllanthi]MPY45013.1 amino acid adenylation domain-containing protein [Streptomyces phyllanthi]